MLEPGLVAVMPLEPLSGLRMELSTPQRVTELSMALPRMEQSTVLPAIELSMALPTVKPNLDFLSDQPPEPAMELPLDLPMEPGLELRLKESADQSVFEVSLAQ